MKIEKKNNTKSLLQDFDDSTIIFSVYVAKM